MKINKTSVFLRSSQKLLPLRCSHHQQLQFFSFSTPNHQWKDVLLHTCLSLYNNIILYFYFTIYRKNSWKKLMITWEWVCWPCIIHNLYFRICCWCFKYKKDVSVFSDSELDSVRNEVAHGWKAMKEENYDWKAKFRRAFSCL